MATYQEVNEKFNEWLRTQYKAVVASQIFRGYLAADAFLTGLNQEKAMLKSTPEQINEYIDELNRNRLFKNSHREVMSLLPRMKRALCDFVSSEDFERPHEEKAVAAEDADLVINAIEKDESKEPRLSLRETQEAFKYGNATQPINGTVLKLPVKVKPESKLLTDVEKIQHIFDTCNIRLEGYTVSREDICEKFIRYLIEHADADSHNVLFSLGTGSIIFTALAVVYGVFACLVKNNLDTEAIITNLQPGDKILYNNGIREFVGYEEKDGVKYLLAKQSRVSITKLPQQAWKNIQPYNGGSTMLDGRGIRKSKGVRELFYKKVLNYKDNEIPSMMNTSLVIVISREKADYLMDQLAIDFDGHTVKILDLVTASYFTENSEYTYAGNTGKNEAVLQFACKTSVARNRAIKRGGNRPVGFIIADEDNIVRSESELPEILGRQSIGFVNVVGSVHDAFVQGMLESNEDASLFACTTDFLLSCKLKNTYYNKFTYNLYIQADTQIDRTNDVVVIDDGPTWNEMYEFRKAIFNIRAVCGEQQAAEMYIMYAWSALNLLNAALFDITSFDQYALNTATAVSSFEKKLDIIRENQALLPTYLESSFHVINGTLEKYHEHFLTGNPKYERLVSLLEERVDSKICVVVPSTYFGAVLKSVLSLARKKENFRIPDIVSATKFDQEEFYDTIIVTGNITGKRFDAFRCSSATEIISLLYRSENNIYIKRAKDNHARECLLNKRSSVEFVYDEDDDNGYDSGATATEVAMAEDQQDEIDRLIDGWGSSNLLSYNSYTGNGSQDADVAMILAFDSGEKAFLTPNYKAYVYNPTSEEVAETAITDLSEGDTLVFTKHDNETKDIVDDILKMLQDKERLSQEDIRDCSISKKWRNALFIYMKINKMTPRELARNLVKSGLKLNEMTVVNWLDEDNHIVGPRDLESIRIIGKYTGTKELENNAEEYHNACKRVIQIRKLILRNMSRAMRDKLGGKQKPINDPILADIYDRLDSRAEILTIEKIINVETRRPGPMTNRPIEI